MVRLMRRNKNVAIKFRAYIELAVYIELSVYLFCTFPTHKPNDAHRQPTVYATGNKRKPTQQQQKDYAFAPVLALLLLATGVVLPGAPPTVVFARCTAALLLADVVWLFPHFPVNVSMILLPKVRMVPPVALLRRGLLPLTDALTGVVLITWALGVDVPLPLLGEVGEKFPSALNSKLGFCWFAKDF